MKTIKNNKAIFLFIILFSACSLVLTSCKRKAKIDNPILDTKINTEVVIKIAESNLKIIAIVKKAQESNIEEKSRIVFQLIERDHIQLKNRIRKIAKNHFIVIPSILYDKNVLKNSTSKITTYKFLKRIENILIAELKYYTTSVITANNNDLKILAKEAIPKIKKNIEIVQAQQQ